MSVVFLIFSNKEPLSGKKSLDYVGYINKFSNVQFTAEVRHQEIEMPEGYCYLFIIYDAVHDTDRLHTIFYDTPFDKAKFINEVAEGERKRFVLIKGACDANS